MKSHWLNNVTLWMALVCMGRLLWLSLERGNDEMAMLTIICMIVILIFHEVRKLSRFQ